MLFQLFWMIILLSSHSFAQDSFDSYSNQNYLQRKPQEAPWEKELYARVKDMSEVIGMRGGNREFLEISGEVESHMRRRCPEGYSDTIKAVKEYNNAHTLARSYASGGRVNPKAINEKELNKHIGSIEEGVKECVVELRKSYVDLSHGFVSPITKAYNYRKSSPTREIDLLTQDFVNDLSMLLPADNSKAGQVRRYILEYNDFQDKCVIRGSGAQPAVITLESQFNLSYVHASARGVSSVKDKFDSLGGFLRRESRECYPKLERLRSFAGGEIYSEFRSLPGRCQESAHPVAGYEKIERLKRGVKLLSGSSAELNVSDFDVVNYCREELEKTANTCSCGREDCSMRSSRSSSGGKSYKAPVARPSSLGGSGSGGSVRVGERGPILVDLRTEGDSVWSKIYAGSRELCGRSSVVNKAMGICERKADRCLSGCNKRLESFKREYKDVFFVSDLSLKSNIHERFKTACVSPMREIAKNWKESILKPPYSREEGLRGRSLSSVRDLGRVCASPLKRLALRGKSLNEKCGRLAAEEEKEEEKKALTTSNQVQGQNAGSDRRVRTGSQEDEIRERYRGKKLGEVVYNSRGWDNEEFDYGSRGGVVGGAGTGSLSAGAVGSGSSYKGGVVSSSDKGGYSRDEREGDGYKERGEDKSRRELSGKESGMTAGAEEGDKSQVSILDRMVRAPSRLGKAVKSKTKEVGVKMDKHIRDYLLSDTDLLMYKYDYQSSSGKSEEEKNRLRGIPRELKGSVYSSYNKKFPISREEWRKRMGVMKEGVDLEEVQDLLFYRWCYVTWGKAECDDPNDPEAEFRTLEGIITRYNELAETQLITPKERRLIIEERVDRSMRKYEEERIRRGETKLEAGLRLSRELSMKREAERKWHEKRQKEINGHVHVPD